MSLFLQSLLQSPLAREPQLALRKVAKRIGCAPRPGPRETPAGIHYEAPATWPARLRAWFDRCGVTGELLPATRVFGQDFSRDVLLKILRNEPERRDDLRGDVKLAWDFARSHHMPINAHLAGDGYAAQAVAEMRELMESPPGSPFWSCPMDVAIRAVNWIAADALTGGAISHDKSFAGWMWQHLDVIWRQLEARRVSSNHYLSNLLGLVVLGRALPGDALAERCLAFARREWPRALLSQTNDDGGLNEASLRYHAFVTEMALLARIFDDAPWPKELNDRLDGMCQVAADHLDGSDDVFAVGDDDGGRVIAPDLAAACGRARSLFWLEEQARGISHAPRATWTYPRSGWWISHLAGWHAHFEFGGTGLWGEGAHAHDDDLSVCLSHGASPLLCDPGSYIYTPDRAARDRFRSAHYHTTVRLLPDGAEPQPLKAEDFFLCRGRNAPLPVEAAGDGIAARLGGIRREVKLDATGLFVSDEIAPTPSTTAWWFFHLHPDVRWQPVANGAELEAGGMKFSLVLDPPLALSAAAAEFSPRYGTRVPSTVLRARCDSSRGTRLSWSVGKR